MVPFRLLQNRLDVCTGWKMGEVGDMANRPETKLKRIVWKTSFTLAPLVSALHQPGRLRSKRRRIDSGKSHRSCAYRLHTPGRKNGDISNRPCLFIFAPQPSTSGGVCSGFCLGYWLVFVYGVLFVKSSNHT